MKRVQAVRVGISSAALMEEIIAPDSPQFVDLTGGKEEEDLEELKTVKMAARSKLSEHRKPKSALVHCEIDRTFFGRYRCSCEKTFSKRAVLNSHLFKYDKTGGATRQSNSSSDLDETMPTTPIKHGVKPPSRRGRGKNSLRKLEQCLCGSTFPTRKALDKHLQQKI